MFGPNSKVSVKGSFHVSTADVLRFEEGGTFYADLSNGSTLTMKSPMAFGFLSENPAPITIQGDDKDRPILRAGEALSLVGGDISIEKKGVLSARRIQLASVRSEGDVVFHPSESILAFNIDDFEHLGEIFISNSSILSSRSGRVVIRGGRLEVRGGDSSIRGQSQDAAETSIDIQVRADMVVADNANIQGHGGRVVIRGERLAMRSGGSIETSGAESGIDIQVMTDIVVDQSTIHTVVSEGQAGDIKIQARHLNITRGASASSSLNFGIGIAQGASFYSIESSD